MHAQIMQQQLLISSLLQHAERDAENIAMAPIPDPQKYLTIGMNYHDHAEEARHAGLPLPGDKQVSCITGSHDPIYRPRVSDKMDYEAELGVVIGKRCRYVAESDACHVIGGYFVANDVTSRDWQFQSPTFTLGKSFDSHGPIGRSSSVTLRHRRCGPWTHSRAAPSAAAPRIEDSTSMHKEK